jgi:uncharacterized RDD family membrane protein YckC
MQEIFCSKCGARNTGAGQFCQKCGATLWPSPSVPPGQLSPPAYAPPVAYIQAVPSPYAGFWIRFLAYIIDRIVIGLVGTPVFLIMALPAIGRVVHEAQQHQEPSPEFILSMAAALSAFFVVLFAGYWLYEALLTSSPWQGTVGKRVLGLRVTDESGERIGFGRATARFFAKSLSFLILYIGFIMAAFTERKRALHDMIAGTLVMKS